MERGQVKQAAWLPIGIFIGAVAAVLALIFLSAESPASLEVPVDTTTANATKVLDQLTVKKERWGQYSRAEFPHWETTSNGCNTRSRVLGRESTDPVNVSKNGCTVLSGRWSSPYDATTTTKASDVEIDHMVPLAEAWRSGAREWTISRRTAFANDLAYSGSLKAVSSKSNQSKSDSDPSKWVPSKAGYRCAYAKTWVAVKYRWNLSIDSREKSAIASLLRACSDQTMQLPERAP